MLLIHLSEPHEFGQSWWNSLRRGESLNTKWSLRGESLKTKWLLNLKRIWPVLCTLKSSRIHRPADQFTTDRIYSRQRTRLLSFCPDFMHFYHYCLQWWQFIWWERRLSIILSCFTSGNTQRKTVLKATNCKQMGSQTWLNSFNC